MICPDDFVTEGDIDPRTQEEGAIVGHFIEEVVADSMMAVVSAEVDFVVVNSTAVDFMIATSGDVSASASTRTTL